MLCVAAHVTQSKGLLTTLTASRRAEVWKHSELHACSVPGDPNDSPPEFRSILLNKESAYNREHTIAILNAQDIKDPADLSRPGTITEIKMSVITLEGLRQAFIDPETRVRRGDQIRDQPHPEIAGIRWQSGGFLGDAELALNSNLNVFIGGRGAGKSTVIESIRYALDLPPLTEEAQAAHEGIVRRVLGTATQITLLVRVHSPARREYLVERIVPNPPTVRDLEGEPSNLRPADLLAGIEIYGQHEIAELCRDREKLTGLLRRFAPDEAPLRARKSELQMKLAKSRRQLGDVQRELAQLHERIQKLPALEEMLKKFASSGFEDRLKDQAWLISEERVLKTARERLDPVREASAILGDLAPVDVAFLTDKAIEELPAKGTLARLRPIFAELEKTLARLTDELSKALASAEAGIGQVHADWQTQKEARKAATEKVLRDLQKSLPNVDVSEFGKLHQRIADLLPLRERQSKLQHEQQALTNERAKLLKEWEDTKAEHHRLLAKAAKKLSREAGWRVRVTVDEGGKKDGLAKLLADTIGGTIKPIYERLTNDPGFSLPRIAAACREGSAKLMEEFGLTPTQANRLCQGGEALVLQLEELDFPFETRLELNLGDEGRQEWRELDALSKGQKATAVLLLLLLESDAPLIVDQPEDDLDNRFIMEGVVPRIREEKQRRQFIFATHNANIPVLGDAELIAVLEARGEPGSTSAAQAQFVENAVGSIDNDTVRGAIGEILEGGKTAFETRRIKYGY